MRNRWVAAAAAVSVGLGACQALLPGQTNAKRPVTTQATAKPSQAPSRKPVLPEGPMATVRGTIAIDAHYVVSHNAGSVVLNAGGSAIALKGGRLISDNGLGLISDNGLGLISDNGLGVIANNGSSYRVRAAGDLVVGTVLPVKGMAVFPLSMRTGEVVGKPVFTDDQGGYAVQVPEGLKGNIRLVARVPVAAADDPLARDPRLQYNLVTAAAAANPVINEDTSVTTRYLRACFAERFKEMMLSTDPAATAGKVVSSMGFDPTLQAFLTGTVVEINKTAQEAGVALLSDERAQAVAQRMTDVLLSYVDLAAIVVDPAANAQPGAKEPAVAALTDIVRRIRTGAGEKSVCHRLKPGRQPLGT